MQDTLTGVAMAAEADMTPGGLVKTLAHHDAAIVTLSSRITGVETGLKTLQGEVHTGFATISAAMVNLSSKLDKLDSRPQFDFSKIVSTILHLGLLFTMTVGGIIWVASGQPTADAKQAIGDAAVMRYRVEMIERTRTAKAQ